MQHAHRRASNREEDIGTIFYNRRKLHDSSTMKQQHETHTAAKVRNYHLCNKSFVVKRLADWANRTCTENSARDSNPESLDDYSSSVQSTTFIKWLTVSFCKKREITAFPTMCIFAASTRKCIDFCCERTSVCFQMIQNGKVDTLFIDSPKMKMALPSFVFHALTLCVFVHTK